MRQRDTAIDVARGLAVFTMVAANMAAEGLRAPHPFWFRAYGSFAAPLFITIAGMMVALTSQRRNYGFGYYARRGGTILLVGVLVEVLVWQIVPLTGFDVLYLIGWSVPLVYLVGRLRPAAGWIVMVAVFAITPFLQAALGYVRYPTEYVLGEAGPMHLWENVLRHWVIDGWFPLFPWLGFALLGGNLGAWRGRGEGRASFSARGPVLTGAVTLLVGFIVWQVAPGPLYVRDGYSELFYPPTPGYLLAAAGVVVLTLSTADRWPEGVVQRALASLGRSALFLYVLHLVVVEYVTATVWPNRGLAEFALLYAGVTALLVGVAYGLGTLRARWTQRPYLARVLLGS